MFHCLNSETNYCWHTPCEWGWVLALVTVSLGNKGVAIRMETKKQIAIISTNHPLRSALHDALHYCGLECVSVASIREYVSLKASAAEIGLIIFDSDDAVMSPPVVTMASLQDLSRDIPLIGLTGKPNPQLHKLFSGSIRKPFEMADFLTLIRPFLQYPTGNRKQPSLAHPSQGAQWN
jgi:DNA-binding NtrC family response regulator